MSILQEELVNVIFKVPNQNNEKIIFGGLVNSAYPFFLDNVFVKLLMHGWKPAFPNTVYVVFFSTSN